MTSRGREGSAIAVYRAVLRFPDLDDDGLAGRVGVTSAEVSAAFETLQSWGIVRVAGKDEVRQIAHPDEALLQLVLMEQSRSADRLSELNDLRRARPQMLADYEAGIARKSEKLEFEVLRGLPSVWEASVSLMRACTSDYAFIMNVRGASQPIPPDDYRPQHEEQADAAIARGVRYREILPALVRDFPKDHERWAADHMRGQELRLSVTDLPPQMAIFDQRIALVPIDLEQTALGAVLVRSESVVASLVLLFEKLWIEATPIVRRPEELGALRRGEILKLLAAGAKDETIARAVNVGMRTVRREIAEMMDELGAQSRFQLGALALQQGWISV